jgi:hypothetical protein
MESDLPNDAVEMVRAIRTRHYEATKHMTREEKQAHDKKRYDGFKKLMKEVNPNDYDFSWLRTK